jgi:hypothetical protein
MLTLMHSIALRYIKLNKPHLGSCMCTVRSMHSLSCLKRARGCIEATTARALLLALAFVSVSPGALASFGASYYYTQAVMCSNMQIQ